MLWRIGAGAGVLVIAATIIVVANLGRFSPAPVDSVSVDFSSPAGGAVAGDVEVPNPEVEPTSAPVPASIVDAAWLSRVSAATGIPARALQGYASAELTIDAEQPGCGVGWNTLAGIGHIETGHGTHGGSSAVFSYNHLDSYVDAVAASANRYAEAARSAP